MFWLNTAGQTTLLQLRKDVGAYLDKLSELAKRHFENGAPLDVPDDVIQYIANNNRIRLPSLGIIAAESLPTSCSGVEAIGFVNCGPKELVIDKPVVSVQNVTAGHKDEATDVFYDIGAFVSKVNEILGPTSCHQNFATSLFSSPSWAFYVEAAKQFRVGFFVIGVDPGGLDDTTIEVYDPTDRILDPVSYLYRTTSNPFTESVEGSAAADIGIEAVGWPAETVFGRGFACELAITNRGPGAAYGVTIALPHVSSFEYLSINGLPVDAGPVYDLGGIASGGVRKLAILLAPITTEPLAGPLAFTAEVGDGLLDSTTANNTVTLPAVTVAPLNVKIDRGGNVINVRWGLDARSVNLNLNASNDLRSWVTVELPVPFKPGPQAVQIKSQTAQEFFRLDLP